MKLLRKTNRYFLISIFGILIFSWFLLFLGIRYIIRQETVEKLKVDEYRLVELMKKDVPLESFRPLFEIVLSENSKVRPDEINKVSLYDPVERENEDYLELSSVREINGRLYALKVRHSLIETDELILLLTFTFIGVMLISLLLLFIINRKVSRHIWAPFYSSLKRINTFSLEKGTSFRAPETDIDEFQQMNHSLKELTTKLVNDYHVLKEFTENASHEIQTPLAVILMKLEEIIQSELDPDTNKKIYVCYQSALRLSRLNEKLLLLTKLDNEQFAFKNAIDLTEILTVQLEEIKPLLEDRSIDLEVHLTQKFPLKIDPGLGIILIVNLLSNAVKYNVDGGKIIIELKMNQLTISNITAEKPEIQTIFDRFKKSAQHPESMGLGLSIAKKISEQAGLHISAEISHDLFSVVLENTKQE